MAFDKGNQKNASQQDTATGSAPDPIFAQPRDSSQEQAWSGAHPLASASWDSSVSDLLAGQGDVTGDAIIRLFTEQAQMIKEKFDVQIVAHQTSRDNFRIGWSGVAIIAKKVINNTSFSSGFFLYCEDSVEAMSPRSVRIQDLGADSMTRDLPVHPINAWEDPNAQQQIQNRFMSLSGDQSIHIAGVLNVPKNYVINDNTKERNLLLVRTVIAALIDKIEKAAGRTAFPLRGGMVKRGDQTVQDDGDCYKLVFKVNHGADPVDILGQPVRADWSLVLQKVPRSNQNKNNSVAAFQTERPVVTVNGYTDYLYSGQDSTQYMVGMNAIPPSFIPVPVVTNVTQHQNNWSEFNVLALPLALALFQGNNFLSKWEPSAVFDTMHNIGALNIQGIRPGGATGVRINTQDPNWNMGILQATFGGMIQPTGLICFDVNSFTLNGSLLELLLMSTLQNDMGAKAKSVLIAEFDRATAGRFSKSWDVSQPMAQRMGVYPTGYFNYQEKQGEQIIQYQRDIRAVDYLAVCNHAANSVPTDTRVPLEQINDYNATRDPRRTPDYQMYGTLQSIERVLGPNFTSTGHVHRIAVQANLLRHLMSLINSGFQLAGFDYSGMAIGLDAQRVATQGFSFDPGVFGQGLMTNAQDQIFGTNTYNTSGGSNGSNMFGVGSNAAFSAFM